MMSFRRFPYTVQPRLLYLLFVFFIGLLLMSVQSATGLRGGQQTAVSPLKIAPNSLSFSVTFAEPAITTAGEVTIDGLTQRNYAPGSPDLPYYSTFIALPPDGEVSTLSVTPAEISAHNNAYVQPAPSADRSQMNDVEGAIAPFARVAEDGETILGYANPPTVRVEDTAVYAQNSLYPDVAYTLSEPMQWRDVRVVELRLYPARYNPQTAVLQHISRFSVALGYSSPNATIARTSNATTPLASGVASQILNANQAASWRHLPTDVGQTSSLAELSQPAAALGRSDLPLDNPTYKIEVNEDGIYEINGAALQAAGMNLSTATFASIEMMYRGDAVAYDYTDGNGNGRLDSTDTIRFFGWSFNGPREEAQYITNNVYWLWANGTSTHVQTIANPTSGSTITSFRDTINTEPEGTFFSTWTNRWDQFPNDPDAVYWAKIIKSNNQDDNNNPGDYTVNLPNPTSGGATANYTAEFMTNRTPVVNGIEQQQSVETTLNGNGNTGTLSWSGHENVNLTDTINSSVLLDGTNVFTIDVTTNIGSATSELYLNRITVEYTRDLVPVADQLIFGDSSSGNRVFQLATFSNDDAVVWNITNQNEPDAVDMSGSGRASGGIYRVGTNANSPQFIATTEDNLMTPLSIAEYTPSRLTPSNCQNNEANCRVEWLAITHSSLTNAANQLANYRATANGGSYDTYVVQYADLVNQYGYGLPLPTAIQDYLRHTLTSWQTAPSYVTLFGDATINPRQVECPECTQWEADVDNPLMTNLLFVDRFQGLIPSDHPFVTLLGDDLLPEMAIGRISARTLAQANDAVDKILLYEANGRNPAFWNQEFVFVADNADDAGDFCAANENAANLLPDKFSKLLLCLPDNFDGLELTEKEILVDDMRTEMFSAINENSNPLVVGEGAFVLNYRGHGSVNFWGARPNILTSQADSLGAWLNPNAPTVILSADCLDGHFAWANNSTFRGMGETFLTMEGDGTAAHWSSSGLGFTFEHTILHREFYEALFVEDYSTIGDAINYAKVSYLNLGMDESEVYGFTLQGDPALNLYWANLQSQYLPFVQNGS